MELTILIPAAGASSRMRGRDKLLETVDSVPLLRRCVARALATDWPVVVALSRQHPNRRAALDGIAATLLDVRDAQLGMGASIRDAMAKLPANAKAVMILPADMPDLETQDLQLVGKIFAEDPNNIVRGASEDGTPGHPVVFPKRLFEKLRALDNVEGAKAALVGEHAVLCPLPGRRALTDLDTPEDWARWRAR